MTAFKLGWSLAAAATLGAVCVLTPAFAASPDVAADTAGGRIYGDAARGKEYVERWCVTCHAMGVRGTDGAPPLALLKKDPKKTGAYIRGFLANPHKPMPPMALTTQEVEDIITYLLGSS